MQRALIQSHTFNICKIEVKISFGGEANWNSHPKSWAHHENESKISKSRSLTIWIKKSVAKPKAAGSFPALPTLLNEFPLSFKCRRRE
jgi:hypothetical protein